MKTRATTAETTATGERVKECQRSPSKKRLRPSARRAPGPATPPLSSTRLPSPSAMPALLLVPRGHGLVGAQAGVDRVVQQVDDEIDDHEEEADQHRSAENTSELPSL